MTVDPAGLVRRLIMEEGLGDPAAYPHPLAVELVGWVCYVLDSGYCLLVVPESLYRVDASPEDMLLPVPVRTVLRQGWRLSPEGYVVANVVYDDELGALAEPNDEEFAEMWW